VFVYVIVFSFVIVISSRDSFCCLVSDGDVVVVQCVGYLGRVCVGGVFVGESSR